MAARPLSVSNPSTLEIHGPRVVGEERVLTPGALEFLAALTGEFLPRVHELLSRRRARQARIRAGEPLDFLPETARLREDAWSVAPIPRDLLDRRVEITGPVDCKMIINALNSGANVFMADFEDSTSPTWANLVQGQLHLADAVRGSLEYADPLTGKQYRVDEDPATLMVRPRGWHLPEAHLGLSGRPVSGALVDFGLFFFHNARELTERGTGPYFYLPKLQSHLEARLWNDVFVWSQAALGIPAGSIRATVLIETLPAAFEMHEILYELRDHSAGLNCGRWDYIFSMIKTFSHDPAFVFPDRAQVTMEQPCLRSYTQLLVQTCHRRGIHAMGGMAAQIPIKHDPAANQRALDKVRADKLREVRDGHDGTWVAHPGLVALAREVFDGAMAGPHQIANRRSDVCVGSEDLLRVPQGSRTESGLRHNLNVGVRYLEAWLGGLGCVPLDHLMEDAATAEISRAQVWQWLHHRARLEDGREVTPEAIHRLFDEEMAAVRAAVGSDRFEGGRYAEARRLFMQLLSASEFEEFLTLPAYETLRTTSADRED